MSLTSLIISILVGSGAAITGFLSGCEWWQILIFLSVYTILQVSVDILLRVLEQKGIISKKTSNKVKVFLISLFLGGIIEYLSSFLQEKIFGTVSWDYSNWILNINGRTTLIHCTYWGLAGLLYIWLIEPLIPKIENIIQKNSVKILTGGVAILMIFNITISSMAAIRQKERKYNIEATSNIDMFLDKNYPDEYMDKIFANKIEK